MFGGGQLAALTGMTGNELSLSGDQGNKGFSNALEAVIVIDGVLDFLAPESLNKERNQHSADVMWLGPHSLKSLKLGRRLHPFSM